MVEYMAGNKNIAAVTGRQRVMSEYNQRIVGREAHGEPAERDSLFERCMRLLQGWVPRPTRRRQRLRGGVLGVRESERAWGSVSEWRGESCSGACADAQV